MRLRRLFDFPSTTVVYWMHFALPFLPLPIWEGTQENWERPVKLLLLFCLLRHKAYNKSCPKNSL